jgi:hypothetical protein
MIEAGRRGNSQRRFAEIGDISQSRRSAPMIWRTLLFIAELQSISAKSD